MTLRDAAAIETVLAGKNQISVGYSCDLEWVDGVTDDGQKYDAVLFETDAASVTLDVPTVDQGRGVAAGVYQAGMRPGAVVYEIRDTAGKVHGYLMVSSQARVRVWEQTGKGDALVVTVSDVENMPEMGGGGGGGSGGM